VPGISLPLLDKRSYRVGMRLVRHFGGEQEAEKWLSEPRSVLPFNGMTPAKYFELVGESDFQEITASWPLEDAKSLATEIDDSDVPKHNHGLPALGEEDAGWSEACNFNITGCPACLYYYKLGHQEG